MDFVIFVIFKWTLFLIILCINYNDDEFPMPRPK